MAIVQNPLFSQAARGKLGTMLVFSINRGVTLARAYVVPSNPQSDRQVVVRGNLSDVAANWKTAAYAYYDNWTLWAEDHPVTDPLTGNPIVLSAFNAYSKQNAVIKNAGGALINDAPIGSVTPDPLTAFAIVKNAANIDVTFGPSPVPANTAYDVWYVTADSPGRLPGPSEYKHLAYLPAADATPTQVIANGVVGRYYFARARQIDLLSGLASPWLNSVTLLMS